MPESEEDNQDFPPKTKTSLEEHVCAMDFDLDLETSWPLDHMSFISNPMSPFLFSTIPEQPSSPLWTFTDGEDENHAKFAASAFSDCHKIFSCMFCFLFLLDWFSVDFSFIA
jgi:hypothetical protein